MATIQREPFEGGTMTRCVPFWNYLAVMLLTRLSATAVIFSSTSDPAFNTAAPTGTLADSGWQYLGFWQKVLGTPIGPEHFITSAHVGGDVGDVFRFGGSNYIVDGVTPVPGSDLYVWHVTTQFPVWAPLYTGKSEVGKLLTVFGRGTQRGSEVYVGPDLLGWQWGDGDEVLRWGTNTVESIAEPFQGFGDVLVADFNLDSATEGMISGGDSGGPVFVRDDDGIWKLAGVNFDVSGPYSFSASGTNAFYGALVETSGLFARTGESYVPSSGPSEFYATRISAHQEFLGSVIPEPAPWMGMVAGGMGMVAGGMGMVAVRRRRSAS